MSPVPGTSKGAGSMAARSDRSGSTTRRRRALTGIAPSAAAPGLVLALLLLLARVPASECKVHDVIIIGAGMAGITAGKTLSEQGVKNILFLEATDRIGGRMRRGEFAGETIELGATWVEGVNGPEVNPIWTLAQDIKLRTFFSDYSNVSTNIYGSSGAGLVPASESVPAFDVAEESYDFAETLGAARVKQGAEDVPLSYAQRAFGSVPTSPVRMALDYYHYDYEFAEPPRTTSLQATQPLPTFANYGYDIYFVADPRGYVSVVHHLADTYLAKDDPRLLFNKVVNRIKYSANRVTVWTEDGSKYAAKYAIVTVSLGVLQSDLIKFEPAWPDWKLDVLRQYDMAVYTNIFLKFPYKFWPDQEFFLYADRRRGYYPVWQAPEKQHPGANILMVLVTDDDSRRVEQQSNNQTLAEVTEVLRTMFGQSVPDALDIFVPRWWSDRFFRGSFSNWPIGFTQKEYKKLQAPLGGLHFGGEHYDELYNGYVHGAYFSGLAVGKGVAKCVIEGVCALEHG